MQSTALVPFAPRRIKPAITLLRSLPGRAVSAVALVGGAYWLIVDPDKSDTCSQVVQLITGS